MGNGMTQLAPRLYVGNLKDSVDESQLNQNKITHIVSIHDKQKTKLPGRTYLCVEADDVDGYDITQHFQTCCQFIHDARVEDSNNVLVHCESGVSRSVTIIIAYLLMVTEHSWTDILTALRQVRPSATPNKGFKEQLSSFQASALQEERSLFASKYGSNSLNDHQHIQTLLDQYHEG